eukprot:1828079-Prymnesium_polylepis.1
MLPKPNAIGICASPISSTSVQTKLARQLLQNSDILASSKQLDDGPDRYSPSFDLASFDFIMTLFTPPAKAP